MTPTEVKGTYENPVTIPEIGKDCFLSSYLLHTPCHKNSVHKREVSMREGRKAVFSCTKTMLVLYLYKLSQDFIPPAK